MTDKVKSAKKSINDVMQEDKKRLFSAQDIVDILKIDYKSADNILRQFRIAGDIKRHVDKDVNGHIQFAVTIPDAKTEIYVKSKTMGLSKGTLQKKRKGAMPTSKEIRSMFAANITNLSKLEDMVMLVTMRYEELEKEIDKIKRAVKIY